MWVDVLNVIVVRDYAISRKADQPFIAPTVPMTSVLSVATPTFWLNDSFAMLLDMISIVITFYERRKRSHHQRTQSQVQQGLNFLIRYGTPHSTQNASLEFTVGKCCTRT